MDSNQEHLDQNAFLKSVEMIENKFNENSDEQVFASEGFKMAVQDALDELSGKVKVSNFTTEHNKFAFAGLNHILSKATHPQLEELFWTITRIKAIDMAEAFHAFGLFSFVSGALVYLREHQGIAFTWENLLSHLEYNNTVSMLASTINIPQNIRNTGMNYLSSLQGSDVYNNYRVNSAVLNSHQYWSSKVINTFVFENGSQLLQNTELVQLIHNILNYSIEKENYLPALIGKIKYQDDFSNDKQEEIALAVENQKNKYLYPYQIYYNITESLLSKNQTLFFSAVDAYVAYYLFKEQRDVHSELTLQDKVELFYTDYFRTFFTEDYGVKCFSLISLLLHYYDKKLFFSFMTEYKIQANIPVREERDNKNIYLSLFEYCALHGYTNVMNDLIEQNFGINEPFYAKIIERKTVYEYQSLPLSNLDIFSDHDLLYLIENNIITESNTHKLTVDKMVENISIFFYFLQTGKYHAFYKLYRKAKARDASFNLKNVKTIHTQTDLLSAYLSYSNISESSYFDEALLDIFIEEHFDLLTPNNSGVTSLSKFALFPINQVTHLVYKLEVLLPQSYKVELSVPKVLPTPVIEVIDSNKHMFEWFKRDKLEEHLKKIGKDKDGANTEYIKNMLSMNNHLRSNLILQDDSFFVSLKEEFPNFEEIVDFYRGQFKLKKLTGKIRIQPILLLGEPGIGKTFFAKKLSQSLNTGYTFLDMGSLTANWVLSGNNGTWKNAKQGKILEALMNSKTINPLILMDEIDKARNGDYDPTIVLYQLLEEINAVEFTDEFIDFAFNASGIIYIACANSIQTLSEPLLSRFKIFNVPSPSFSQLDKIIDNIYQEAIRDAHLFNPTLSLQVINILKQHSLRNIKGMIDNAISKSLLTLDDADMIRRIKDGNLIDLSAHYFSEPLSKQSIGFH